MMKCVIGRGLNYNYENPKEDLDMQNKESITLKPCTNEDIESIYKMSVKLIDRFEVLDVKTRKTKLPEIKKKIESNISSYHRIYKDEKHLGYVYLQEDSKHIEVNDFFLFEDYEKKSLGQIVVDYMKDLSVNYGKPLFLSIFKMDISSFNLYFSQGFDVYECIKDFQVKMRYQPDNR